jgi:UDP-N-acetyl-D-glucosamine 4,6-dehydratase
MSLASLLKPTNIKRISFFVVVDILISISTVFIAYLLRFNFAIPSQFFPSMLQMMMILIPLKILLFFIFRIYFVAWRYFGLGEYKKLLSAHLFIYPFFAIIFLFLYNSFWNFPRSVMIIDFFLSLTFIGFLRISRRIYLESQHETSQVATLIFGANEQATHIVKSSSNGDIEYNPKVLISDEYGLGGTYFSNLKVYRSADVAEVIKKYAIHSVIITEVMSQERLDMLFTQLKHLGIQDIKIAQMFQDDKPSFSDISIEDLLARKPKDLDMISIANYIAGKVVMITGAGGSIGSELSRQVALFGAKQIILLDHSEYNLYQISEELKGKNIVSVMLSVKDREALEEVFVQYLPDVVLHAAAYKHVPLCEENVESAVQNNIFGTKNVIDLAIAYDVSKFLLVSTDKAVRPTNVMGTTKRVCELYAHAVPSRNTEIVAVRFGNVLGSSGSVIPKFKSQIEKGQNITVTHPDITRYFMLIPEACQLVLQAASIAKGGELFILDMGEPIKIVDLAKRMIELSGRDDIEVEFTGLRAGEKLYEELLIDDADLKTEYDSIMVSQNPPVDYAILLSQIERLKDKNELEVLKEIVPEFDHKQ